MLAEARGRLTALGCDVEDVELDLGRADEAFETLRALAFARGFGPTPDALRGDRQGRRSSGTSSRASR